MRFFSDVFFFFLRAVNTASDCAAFIFYLGAPQLDGPVERGGDEEVGEVQRAGGRVAVDARDGPVVALEHLADARFAVEKADRDSLRFARVLRDRTNNGGVTREAYFFAQIPICTNDPRRRY